MKFLQIVEFCKSTLKKKKTFHYLNPMRLTLLESG